MQRLGVLIIAILSTSGTAAGQIGTSDFRWPDASRAAVSLTFDDARTSQVDEGAALFDRFDAKATFYVVPSAVEQRIDGWKEIAAAGHEIGNHTLNHPCTGNFVWARDKALEDFTLQMIKDEMAEANRRIDELLGVKPESFAYPCGQTFVGRGINTRSYVPLVAEMFTSGRGWLDEGPNDPAFVDLAQITGIEMDGKEFEAIRVLIERAKETGAWLVLAGHEIGSRGEQTTRVDMLEQLLAYATNPSNEVWMAPVKTVSRYINDRKSRDTRGKIRVLLDTDANNELDDQHAIAYMLFSGDVFDVEGITVNRTRNGGDIHEQAKEAERVVKLSGLHGQIPVIKGADGSFEEIVDHLDDTDFDGRDAVDFIIRMAHKNDERQLVLIPVGKLTNIALALKKDPSIAPKVRIVWLGSNYPKPGEYNQDNDEESLNFLLDTDVAFEIVTVRYGERSGTDAIRVTPQEIERKMAGRGPRIAEAVEGRNGGTFRTFGDYAINLFEHIDLHGDPPSRALFDMAAVAVVKDPSWAKRVRMPAPKLVEGKWLDRPNNTREIILWEDFDAERILSDFFETMDDYVLARPHPKR